MYLITLLYDNNPAGIETHTCREMISNRLACLIMEYALSLLPFEVRLTTFLYF